MILQFEGHLFSNGGRIQESFLSLPRACGRLISQPPDEVLALLLGTLFSSLIIHGSGSTGS